MAEALDEHVVGVTMLLGGSLELGDFNLIFPDFGLQFLKFLKLNMVSAVFG